MWTTAVNPPVDSGARRCGTVIRHSRLSRAAAMGTRGAGPDAAPVTVPHREPGDARPASRPTVGPPGSEVHQQVAPPSTIRLLPVQYDDAPLSRNATGPTISSASAHRPSGMSFA